MRVKLKKWPCLNVVSVTLLFVICCFVDADVKCNLKTNYLCENKQNCIPKKYVCNGIIDCPEKDDEKDCDIERCDNKDKFFLCRDKLTCIGKNLICDNEADCPDASDESDEMCETVASARSYSRDSNVELCKDKEFKCKVNNVCIPEKDMCNGAKNCIDGSDEDIEFCKTFNSTKCPGFLCSNNKCLELPKYICDGTDDCGDGSDEEHCHPSCDKKNGKFLCNSSDECIDLAKICDGKADCTDGSDEGATCNKKIENFTADCKSMACKDNSECKVLPYYGATCFCNDGYKLDQTTGKCEDINECEIFGTCSQGCVNQNGSYYCTCAKGFLLNFNNISCDTTSTNVSLIYTTKNSIKKISFGQRNIFYHSTVSKTKQSIGVAFDGEFYYWTEVDMAREVIVKYNPSTKTREILLTNGLELPEYIAVDWLTKNIYFTDSTRRHIAVCTNDGYYCTELIKIDIMHYPRAIALHSADGLLFWTDWGNNSHIGVAFMDGSGAKVLVDNVSWPNGLALDWANRRIYWIDALSHSIESVKINGEDRRVILNGVFKHPFSLEVFGDKLYWSDHDTKSIEFCDKFTGKNHDLLVQGDEIFDVHIYDQSSMPYSKHGCEGNPCSHICLLKNNGSYSCACPMEMELQSDNHNCRFNSQSYIIHVGIDSKLYSKPFLSFGRNIENPMKQVDGKIDILEFNALNGAIFYADNDNHKLFVLDTIGNSHLLLNDPNLHITSMSFDYLGNNLYWADALKGTIEVLSIHTKKHSIVHHYTGDYHPNSIIVVPSEGEIFVALVSQIDSQINRVSMKGSSMDDSKFQLIRSGLGKGGNFYLAVDEKEKKLYWSDTKKKRIEFAFLNGTERKIFIQSERTPGPLTIVDNYLHWTSEGSKAMQWRRKNGTGPIKLIKIDGMTKSSDFPKTLPITTGNPIKINNHQCAINNGGCSDICISDGQTGKACLCALGRVFKNKAQTDCIERSRCDFRCKSGECIESKMVCDGRVDCIDRSDEDDRKCKKSTCRPSQFQCDDSSCIAKSLRCDKNRNCKDGSDEWNCPKEGTIEGCGDRKIQCLNSTECIYRTQVCDMNPDCPNGTDELEESCNQKCLDSEFKCSSGQCVPKEFLCDHKYDCYDGSDEDEQCSHMCEAPFKACRDGHCIHERFFCDGVNDCEDEFDEFNCGNKTALSKCDENKFQCPSDPKLCLDVNKICDKTSDCPKGEDERNCLRCQSYEFTCSNGHCIDGNLKCDGKSDCNDHSDEEDCNYIDQAPTTCTATNYKCSNGLCLDYSKVCDGIKDCDDDEGGQCSESCSRGKCDQKCNKSPKGLVCSCNKGYQMKSGSDYICTDINECDSTTLNPCSQICTNYPGSYKCSCHPEFVLSGDGHDCKALGDPFKLIYALHNQIRSKDSKNQDLLYEAELAISDMVVDVRKNILMYSLIGENGLYVLNMANKSVELIESFPSSNLLTYDWIAENVYIIERNAFGKLEIFACSMATKKCVIINRFKLNRSHITSIDIDPTRGYLFFVRKMSLFTSKTKTEIVRMRLDGSEEKVLLEDPNLNIIRALSIDIRSKTIYFTEQNSQSLNKMDYDGEARATFVHQSQKLMVPSALSNYENHAYVLDEAHGKISSWKLYQNNTIMNEFNVAASRKFLIAHISKQIDGENKCWKNKCPEICVNADSDKKCLCGNEIGDAKMCAELTESESEVFITRSSQSSSVVWIILIMIALLIVLSGAAYWVYKKRGFNYNMNIGFNRNRGASIHDFANSMQQVPSTHEKDDHQFIEKEKVPFTKTENPNYTEIVNKGFGHSVYPVEEELQDLMNIYDSDSAGKGDIDSNDDDNDHQRLIR